MEKSRIGIIGSGSWATAIAKIVTDNGHSITWWVRQQSNIDYFAKRHHNPHYLRNTYFDIAKINFTASVQTLVDESDIIIIAVPSIHIEAALKGLEPGALQNKKIIYKQYFSISPRTIFTAGSIWSSGINSSG